MEKKLCITEKRKNARCVLIETVILLEQKVKSEE